MPAADVTQIDDLCWTATRYSHVLNIDPGIVRQGLATAPHRTIGKRQVWHVRDGMPAIFKRLWNLDGNGADPNRYAPRERLDHYKAERERIKLDLDTRELLPAAEVRRSIAEAFKAVSGVMDSLPDSLEREAGLRPDAVMLAQKVIDDGREAMYRAAADLSDP